jgi:hypothetical protein
MEQMTLLSAVRQFLTLPGETSAQLRDQWKQFTDKDKADLAAWFPLADPPVEIVAPATK